MDRLFTVTYLPACLAVLVLMLRFKMPPFLTPYFRVTYSFLGFAIIMLAIPLVSCNL